MGGFTNSTKNEMKKNLRVEDRADVAWHQRDVSNRGETQLGGSVSDSSAVGSVDSCETQTLGSVDFPKSLNRLKRRENFG